MSGVLVVMEQRATEWNKMSFEALAAGAALAERLGLGLSAAVLGEGVHGLGQEIAGRGPTRCIR